MRFPLSSPDEEVPPVDNIMRNFRELPTESMWLGTGLRCPLGDGKFKGDRNFRPRASHGELKANYKKPAPETLRVGKKLWLALRLTLITALPTGLMGWAAASALDSAISMNSSRPLWFLPVWCLWFFGMAYTHIAGEAGEGSASEVSVLEEGNWVERVSDGDAARK